MTSHDGMGELMRAVSETVDVVYKTRYFSPTRAHLTDSGFDLYSSIHKTIWPFCRVILPTGVFLQLPKGYEGQIRGKSGLAAEGLIVHWGTVDTDYRGEIRVVMFNLSLWPKRVRMGDKIAQLVVSPVTNVELEKGVVDKSTSRGGGGFGSTGR